MPVKETRGLRYFSVICFVMKILFKAVKVVENIETIETVKNIEIVETIEHIENVETLENIEIVETVKNIKTVETVENIETVGKNVIFMPLNAGRTSYGFGSDYWSNLLQENNNWEPMEESSADEHDAELPVYGDAPNVPDICWTGFTVESTGHLVEPELPVGQYFSGLLILQFQIARRRWFIELSAISDDFKPKLAIPKKSHNVTKEPKSDPAQFVENIRNIDNAISGINLKVYKQQENSTITRALVDQAYIDVTALQTEKTEYLKSS